MHSEKWDDRFLELSSLVGAWSKDPSTKVGAVIVRPDKTIASVGYNGFPRGYDDVYGTREDKLLKTVHAELNAILSAREPLHGHTIYVSPLCPCSNCAAAIVQAGITSAVFQMGATRPEWAASFEATKQIFTQAGVSVRQYPTR